MPSGVPKTAVRCKTCPRKIPASSEHDRCTACRMASIVIRPCPKCGQPREMNEYYADTQAKDHACNRCTPQAQAQAKNPIIHRGAGGRFEPKPQGPSPEVPYGMTRVICPVPGCKTGPRNVLNVNAKAKHFSGVCRSCSLSLQAKGEYYQFLVSIGLEWAQKHVKAQDEKIVGTACRDSNGYGPSPCRENHEFRFNECERYGQCLDLAAKKLWTSFQCVGCRRVNGPRIKIKTERLEGLVAWLPPKLRKAVLGKEAEGR